VFNKEKLWHLVKLYIFLNLIMVGCLAVCRPLYENNMELFWFLSKYLLISGNITILIGYSMKTIEEYKLNKRRS
jgi:hypothetical protein